MRGICCVYSQEASRHADELLKAEEEEKRQAEKKKQRNKKVNMPIKLVHMNLRN